MGGCVNPKTYLLLSAFSLMISTASAGIIYVDADAPGANNGSSWADAYNFLQDALADANLSTKPVEIRVAEGIYKPDETSAEPNGTGDRTATFQLINGVTLKGGYADFDKSDPNSRDVNLYETVLSGDLDANDIDVDDPCDLLYEPTRAENSYNVVFSYRADATAILDGFTITAGNDNRYECLRSGVCIPSGSGGGMKNTYGNPTVTKCIFSSNSAGIGGAMTNVAGYNMRLTNTIFTKNSSVAGGAIGNVNSRMVLTNCVFIGNYAQQGGGVFHFANGSIMTLTLTNCTFAMNSAANGKALACYCPGTYPIYPVKIEVTNCILWDGGNEIWITDRFTIALNYSDVWGGWLGQGNFDADPCFVGLDYWDANGIWVNGDFHLLEDSPCIDAGDPNYMSEPNETDLDGKPRVIGGRIDMGAYEYSPLIQAEVRIVPRTINLASKGKWVTCYIWLGEGYDVADIDSSSFLLEDELGPQWVWLDEEEQVAMVMFSREEVQSMLDIGDVELTITGQLTDGAVFEAKDVIIVIDKGSRKSAKQEKAK